MPPFQQILFVYLPTIPRRGNGRADRRLRPLVLGYVLFEVPANIVLKKLDPKR